MPAPLAVDREAVRVLAVAVGPREAARRMKLPEATVCAWSAREGWLEGQAAIASAISGATTPAKAAIAETLPVSMRPVAPIGHASGAITPAQALQEVLAERQQRTKLAQSRYVADTSEDIADRPAEERIALAGQMHSVAKIGSITWPEAAAGSVRVSIYSGEQPVCVDVDATVLPSEGPDQ